MACGNGPDDCHAMMISLGNGMQALSMAIVTRIPVYPIVEIVLMTNRLRSVMTASMRLPMGYRRVLRDLSARPFPWMADSHVRN